MSEKYPRTFHVPWSKGATNDDKIATDLSCVINTDIIITEKIDGSNTSLEAIGCFARTHSGPPTHLSFDGLKALHSTIKYKIPDNCQLFGEWAFAKHSIEYDKLPGYFLLFAVREVGPSDKFDPIWASWEEVEMWSKEIEVSTVPVLFKGQVKTQNELQELTESFMNQPSCYGEIREGIVIRAQCGFTNHSFKNHVFKMVRENHVQTSEHWKNQEIVKNKLKL